MSKRIIDNYKYLDEDIKMILEIYGGKWTIRITNFLCRKDMRFGELLKAIPDINPKTLTNCLKNLEKHGIINRTQYMEIPPKVVYSLTEKGKEFGHVVHAMAEWGEKYLQ